MGNPEESSGGDWVYRASEVDRYTINSIVFVNEPACRIPGVRHPGAPSLRQRGAGGLHQHGVQNHGILLDILLFGHFCHDVLYATHSNFQELMK